MPTINQVKQLSESDSPLLLFQCALPSGNVENWSTHAISFNGGAYSARVLKHNVFELQVSADDAMDGVSQLSLTLGNADSYLSELSRAVGFKGSQLTVYFTFADLPTGIVTTESTVLFRGVAGDPDEITEESLRLTFTNKLSLQRIPIPEVRIQRSCPWAFPTTPDQRAEAVTGGGKGKYSRYYRCGYSADVPGGCGNLNAGSAFTSCDGSRLQCQQRGMFSADSRGNITQRFAGFEFVPSAIQVRTSGDKSSHLSALIDNAAKYNDPVPLVYGTGWIKAPVNFARNDGNLTHMEAVLGIGQIEGVLKVIVNDVEIPLAIAGQDMTSSGWYSVVTEGKRNGNFNLDFTDTQGTPLGAPYGSICVLSVVVPNRISTGASLPTVEVLIQGLELDTYNLDGTFQSTSYTSNPAWVVLDILKRCGWSNEELDLTSFASAASFCDALIDTRDINGSPTKVPRYQCNLILTRRQSAASVVRGIRVASSLMLRYGLSGLLELLPETSIAGQQTVLPDGSNSVELLNGGWPAYEFSDSSGPFSGIAVSANGSSSLRLSSRTVAETSNRISVEFQDSSNEYQQDGLSIVDSGDSDLIGYEISSQSTALGIANMSQATRVLLRQLDKSTKGNLFVDFQTSFRALKVRPGDIIALTYSKEGLVRAPFRVVKLAPALNYELVTILAQVHDDDWYSDDVTVLAGSGRQPLSQMQTPRPLIGLVPHADSQGQLLYYDLQISEELQAQNDGTAIDTLSVAFSVPTKPYAGSPNLPLLSLAPEYQVTGGTLPGGSTQYYAISAVDSSGNEGALSFTVAAVVPSGTSTNSVSLTGLSFPTNATSFHVYRGSTPQTLYRIASSVPLGTSFVDVGFAYAPIGPPDASFDHANFYCRKEVAGPFAVTSASSVTVSCADMGAVVRAYAGRTVRIVEGVGFGQERVVSTNDGTTITVNPAWSVQPDESSQFVVSETSWKFAAGSSSSPIQFDLAYQPGIAYQITGRGANLTNVESAADLCPVTRLALGNGKADSGTTIAPDFSLTPVGGGLLTLTQVGFDDLTNVSSVSSGTLELFYIDELGTAKYQIASDISSTATTMPVKQPISGLVGQIVQVGSELMVVLSADSNANAYSVARASLGSTASAHSSGDSISYLGSSTYVVPFALSFFENRASVNFLHTITMPDKRICAAQLFVTNAFGDSESTQQCYTTGPEGGLRTLSGGQFSIQVSGNLATQQIAASPVLIEAAHAIRDMRASVVQPATGYDISIELQQSGQTICTILIPSGASVSSVIDGISLPPLIEASVLTTNVSLNVIQNFEGSRSPGRDLTVTIRL